MPVTQTALSWITQTCLNECTKSQAYKNNTKHPKATEEDGHCK